MKKNTYIVLLTLLFVMVGCGYTQPKLGTPSATLMAYDSKHTHPEILFSVKIDGSLIIADNPAKTKVRVSPGKHILGIKVITFYGNRAKENEHVDIPVLIKQNHAYRIKFYPDKHRLGKIDESVSGTIKIYENGRVVASRRVVLADSPSRERIEKIQQDLVTDAIMYSVIMNL